LGELALRQDDCAEERVRIETYGFLDLIIDLPDLLDPADLGAISAELNKRGSCRSDKAVTRAAQHARYLKSPSAHDEPKCHPHVVGEVVHDLLIRFSGPCRSTEQRVSHRVENRRLTGSGVADYGQMLTPLEADLNGGPERSESFYGQRNWPHHVSRAAV
jgi:hypothetical protein